MRSNTGMAKLTKLAIWSVGCLEERLWSASPEGVGFDRRRNICTVCVCERERE